MIGANHERVAGLLNKMQKKRSCDEGDHLLITDPQGFERSLEYEKDWA